MALLLTSDGIYAEREGLDAPGRLKSLLSPRSQLRVSQHLLRRFGNVPILRSPSTGHR